MTTPEDLGFSSERLGRVGALTHGYVDDGRFPGVLTMVTRRGQVAYSDVYGMADIDEEAKLRDDTIFRIFSMSKPITSVALMMLYEEGHFLMENRVARFIPELADLEVWEGGDGDSYTTVTPQREMTVHDLLTHQSGLTYGFQYAHPVDALYRERALGDFAKVPDYDLATAMGLIGEVPLQFSPGTRWNYSLSTDVCGRLIEVISGESLDEFLGRRLFGPLGMVDTGFFVPEEKADRFCALYIRTPGTKELQAMAPSRSERYGRLPTYLGGGGGLVSTAADYHRFTQMLLNGGELDGVRVLGRKTVDYMTINHLPDNATLNEMGQATFAEAAMEGTGFGLGFSVIVDPAASQAVSSVGEYGWGGAASTVFWVDPVEELTVLFFTQLLPSNTYPIRRQLKAAVYQALID